MRPEEAPAQQAARRQAQREVDLARELLIASNARSPMGGEASLIAELLISSARAILAVFDAHIEKASDKRACRVCGCTDDAACIDDRSPSGTCWWVEWHLCSACEAKEVGVG